MKISLPLLALLLGSRCATTVPMHTAGPSPHLLLMAADKDRAEDDFFAVVDVRPSSPTVGKMIAIAPIGHRNSAPWD